LDEVGDMPLPMQAKLLRVLQEREWSASAATRRSRWTCESWPPPTRTCAPPPAAGTFRADLYDRLNVLPLELPPLRARRDDVPMLAAAFFGHCAHANGRPGIKLGEGALAGAHGAFVSGNVRELRNVVERIVILNPDDDVTEADVQRAIGNAGSAQGAGLYDRASPFRVLSEEAERTIIEEAQAHHSGQMAATARALGLERSHLYKKAKALGLRGDAETGDE
jgi:DNA-binding NtrC family response regulator